LSIKEEITNLQVIIYFIINSLYFFITRKWFIHN